MVKTKFKFYLIVLFLFITFPFRIFSGEVYTDSVDVESEFIDEGKALFSHYCSHCHGNSGEGDGFNAEYLDKNPADFTDTEFMAKKSDVRLFRVISKGGLEVKKSFLMPAFGYTLSKKEIWTLISYVRRFSDPAHSLTVPEDMDHFLPQPPDINRENIQAFSRALSNADAYLGEKLFMKKKACFACHQLGDEGGQIGPNLTRAGFIYPPNWLYLWLNHPKQWKPHTKMPRLGLKEDEIPAIAAFLTGQNEVEIPEEWEQFLEGKGDAAKGKQLFFDFEGKANCSRCHRVNDEGGKVGPDLSIIGSSRTREFILESILEPSEVIALGYKSVLILTHDGKFISGIKTNEDETGLDIMEKQGKPLRIRKTKIKKFKTQKVSIMPGNFVKLLSANEIKDLLAYLETLQLPLLSQN